MVIRDHPTSIREPREFPHPPKVGVTTELAPKRGSFCKCTFYYL